MYRKLLVFILLFLYYIVMKNFNIRTESVVNSRRYGKIKIRVLGKLIFFSVNILLKYINIGIYTIS